MSDSLKRERFGRYLILDHLVDGGMAKICRARFLGEQADKVVAIKMVQPQFSKDEAFKTMFMDEIKVTFGLIHPNIIQTYDYGLTKGQLYVAMEYCDGRNLKEYLDKLKDRKFVFPVEISTYIISQACQGLHYAHTFRDKLTGMETNIIHRDISPHNVMLTYDGAVKIIDFGIAKSQTNSESTQAGTIKGKLSYLAPEYLEGFELDARYDEFAIGITLWEMLCSRKLFKENNDLAILKKIQECKIPVPSSINPNVPKELDEIVLKALSKDRNKRYDNLDQMNRALMKFLYAKFPDFNATDLSYFSQELFRDEIKKDREKMFEFGKIDIRPYLEELKREAEGGTNQSAPAIGGTSEYVISKPKEREQVLDFGFDQPVAAKTKPSVVGKKTAMAIKDPTGSREMIDIAKDSDSFPKASASKSSESVFRSGVTKNSVKKLDDTKTRILKNAMKNSSAKKTPILTIAALFAVFIACAAYIYFSLNDSVPTVSQVSIKKPTLDSVRKPATVARGSDEDSKLDPSFKGNVVLSHFDKGKMQAFVDGRKMEVDLLSSIKAPIEKDFILRIQIEGRKHFIKEMRLDNTSAVEVEIPDMPVVAYGYLNTTSACAQGEIRYEVYGEKRVSQIPMSQTFGIAFPLGIDDKGQLAPQSYELYFKKKGEDIERKIEFNMTREDQTIDFCELL